jgi:hypothetical protein
MARSKSRKRFRYKLIGIALAALIAGIGLLKLSWVVAPSEQKTATTSSPVGQTPTDTPEDEDQEAGAQSLSGILLLFSMASFGLTGICIGWLVLDIYNARPAWKTEKKYPKKRK